MKQKDTLKPNIVAFYPSIAQMANNPYWEMLASGLKKKGINFLEEPVSFRIDWLVRNKHRIDILHLHYIQSLYCNSGHTRARLLYVLRFALHLLLAHWLGYRTVLTMHNLEPTNALKPGWVDYLGHWVAVNLSERVIVHCKVARRQIEARYGRSKGIYEVSHPNFIGRYSNQIIKEAARKHLDIPESNRVFLFLGGIRPNKGIETLIKAFKRIKGEFFSLVIAGNAGEQKAYAESLRVLSEDDKRIKLFFYYIPDDGLHVFFNASDIVVLPFTKILTSSSAILAMSFAKPVIAPRMGCLPELLTNDCGWLYEPGSEVSLLNAMQVSLKDDYLGAGDNAFKQISCCTFEVFVQQTLDCYGIDWLVGSEIT